MSSHLRLAQKSLKRRPTRVALDLPSNQTLALRTAGESDVGTRSDYLDKTRR